MCPFIRQGNYNHNHGLRPIRDVLDEFIQTIQKPKGGDPMAKRKRGVLAGLFRKKRSSRKNR